MFVLYLISNIREFYLNLKFDISCCVVFFKHRVLPSCMYTLGWGNFKMWDTLINVKVEYSRAFFKLMCLSLSYLHRKLLFLYLCLDLSIRMVYIKKTYFSHAHIDSVTYFWKEKEARNISNFFANYFLIFIFELELLTI